MTRVVPLPVPAARLVSAYSYARVTYYPQEFQEPGCDRENMLQQDNSRMIPGAYRQDQHAGALAGRLPAGVASTHSGACRRMQRGHRTGFLLPTCTTQANVCASAWHSGAA